MNFFQTSDKLPVRDGEYDIKGTFPTADPFHHHAGESQEARKETFIAYFKSDQNAWYRVNPDTRSEPGNDITPFVTEWAEIGVGDLPQGKAKL